MKRVSTLCHFVACSYMQCTIFQRNKCRGGQNEGSIWRRPYKYYIGIIKSRINAIKTKKAKKSCEFDRGYINFIPREYNFLANCQSFKHFSTESPMSHKWVSFSGALGLFVRSDACFYGFPYFVNKIESCTAKMAFCIADMGK